MKKIILILNFSLLFILISNGQNTKNRILYVIDSIPIINEPKEGLNSLNPNQIDHLTVFKDKKVIDSLGYKDLDGIIYIFTKEYVKRPDSIKKIPSTNNMIKKEGRWFLNNSTTAYSGHFIDYYLDGKKQGEGVFKNGKVTGLRKMYYHNGKTSLERHYSNGVENGIEKEYYEDGTLKQKGVFLNGKENGLWEMYFPNAQLKQRTNFNNGKMNGESVSYYSTGKVRVTQNFVNGTPKKDKKLTKKYNLYQQGLDYDRIGNFKASIKKYTKCLEIDSTFADAYFARGTAKLNNLQFDEAILDFNQTLRIEPFYKKAYGNRAFALIRKFQFEDSKTLSKNYGVTVLITKDQVEIPQNELIKICKDLTKSISLGVKNKMILDAKEKYCN